MSVSPRRCLIPLSSCVFSFDTVIWVSNGVAISQLGLTFILFSYQLTSKLPSTCFVGFSLHSCIVTISNPMTILHHSTLGTIQGESNHGVVQYLGIKYASLKHRFGPAELYNGPGTSVGIDATQLG